MKKLLPFALMLVLVGQGCLTPAQPEPSNDTMMEQNADTTMEGEAMMEGDAAVTMEGEAMMEDGVAVFEISAKNFAFSPNKITVKKGQKVRIKLTSESGFHDWTVDEFNAHTIRVNAGESAVVEFTPDKAGTFQFYCSVGQHRANGVIGTLVVEEAPADAMMIDIETDAAVEVDAVVGEDEE